MSLILTILAAQAGSFERPPQEFSTLEPAAEEAPRLRLFSSVTGRYVKGDYGTGRELESFQVLLSASVLYDRFDLTVTQYHLSNTAEKTETDTSFGMPVTRTVEEEESGAGDTYVALGYLLAVGAFQAHFSAGVKVATAEEGLGTGEEDFFAFLTLSRWFGRWGVIGRAGRMVLGDTSTAEYEDAWIGAVGLGYRATEVLEPRLWLRGQTATSEGSEDALELALTGDWAAGRSVALTFEGAAGLTAGAADWTTGLGVRIHF